MTAASTVKEKQSLETGMTISPTISKDNSTVWSLLLGDHTLGLGETVTATPNNALCATTVSSLIGYKLRKSQMDPLHYISRNISPLLCICYEEVT